MSFWDQLALDAFWQGRLPPSREGTHWLSGLKTLVAYRLIDPPAYYLVGTPKGRLSRYEAELAGRPWQRVALLVILGMALAWVEAGQVERTRSLIRAARAAG